MLELLANPDAWIALLTLTLLEVVLGIDNLVFLAILAGRLPPARQAAARRLGLAAALLSRLILLSMLAWIVTLTQPVFELLGRGVSWRDLILIAGGIFLIVKGSHEIHGSLEGEDDDDEGRARATPSFTSTVIQIGIVDIVFSLDSVITAVGMAQHLPVMIAAVVLAMMVMLAASGPLARFVSAHPTVKMLALSFLLLIGMALIADGMGVHIPKGYIYAAMAFSMMVEILNLLARRKRRRQPIKLRSRI